MVGKSMSLPSVVIVVEGPGGGGGSAEASGLCRRSSTYSIGTYANLECKLSVETMFDTPPIQLLYL